MPSRNIVDFLESHQSLPLEAQFVRPAAQDEIIEVSVYLKPRPDISSTSRTEHTRLDLRESLNARRAIQHADDIRLLRDFAAENGLNVSEVQPGRRLIKLSGTAAQMQTAFGTTLSIYNDGRREFRGRTGLLRLPEDVHSVVESVLGLDNRQAAEPQFISLPQALQPAVVTGHLPKEIGKLYGFPSNVKGGRTMHRHHRAWWRLSSHR